MKIIIVLKHKENILPNNVLLITQFEKNRLEQKIQNKPKKKLNRTKKGWNKPKSNVNKKKLRILKKGIKNGTKDSSKYGKLSLKFGKYAKGIGRASLGVGIALETGEDIYQNEFGSQRNKKTRGEKFGEYGYDVLSTVGIAFALAAVAGLMGGLITAAIDVTTPVWAIAGIAVGAGIGINLLLENIKLGGKSLKEWSADAGDYLWKKGKKALSNVVDNGKKIFGSIFS
ncbi:MAG: hypothetical protein ABF289_13560 [Clostridiales bacterium]